MAYAYVSVTGTADTGIRTVRGYQFAENGVDPGAEARIVLRDGNGGAVIGDVRLAAKESIGFLFPKALTLGSTLYVEVSAGAVRGAVYGG